MKKIYSLKGRNLFKEVYKKGRKLQDKGIRLFILPSSKINQAKPGLRDRKNGTDKLIKIGITINRKFGKAYIRNRAKRRIRAICLDLFDQMKDEFYIIINLNTTVNECNFEEQKRVIKSLFKKGGVLNR